MIDVGVASGSVSSRIGEGKAWVACRRCLLARGAVAGDVDSKGASVILRNGGDVGVDCGASLGFGERAVDSTEPARDWPRLAPEPSPTAAPSSNSTIRVGFRFRALA